MNKKIDSFIEISSSLKFVPNVLKHSVYIAKDYICINIKNDNQYHKFIVIYIL